MTTCRDYLKIVVVVGLVFSTGELWASSDPIYSSVKQFYSPERTALIYRECSSTPPIECNIVAKVVTGSTNEARELILWKKIRKSAMKVRWFSNELASVVVSCGSPCNYTKYFHVKYGMSPTYELISKLKNSAASAKYNLVVVPSYESSPNGGESGVIYIRKIFSGQEVQKIYLPDMAKSIVPAWAIKSVNFTEHDEVELNYAAGVNFVLKKITVPLSSKAKNLD